MKTIYILIGPKGSGKTYIGELIQKKLAIKFLSVEPYFLHATDDAEVLDEKSFAETWKKIGMEISKHFKNYDKIIFESTGTFKSFKKFLNTLQKQKEYEVKLIKIKTPQELCLRRTGKRDISRHVPMSKKLIKRINKIAIKEKYPFDIVINNARLSDEEIIEIFKKQT